MSDRFDLEQNIMQCWNVTDDIQLALDQWDKLDEDAKQNYLIGLQQMYQMKFERLWDNFEGCVRNKQI
jgi:molecular chaperone GrpE (heat shock protein)